jgi:exonuclease SbcC
MKILHTSDIHLGDLNGPIRDGRNARRQDTIDCMRFVVGKAIAEMPNVTIIAGDLFNRSRVWADTALEDITDAIDLFLRPLCRASDHVVLLFGTENHDNPLAFEVIRQTTQDEKNLHIYTTPGVHRLVTREGAVQIMAIPGYDKGRLRAFMPDVDKETENRNATALINDVVLGLSTQLDKETSSILVAHYTVAGTTADNGATFLAGQDVVILPQTIDATGVTMACLGHIHSHQRLDNNTPTYYSGSPNQLNFNDEGDEHGAFLHYLEDGAYSRSYFMPAPERQHYTLILAEADIADILKTGTLELAPSFTSKVTDAIVRVRYNATAEQDKALNKAELQKSLMAHGAFYVAEILPNDIDEGVTSYEEDADNTPPALLHRYLETANTDPADMARLEELAAPLIRKADDGREAGVHIGAFTPKRVEVKNYRSYTAAEFDFSDIRMAMVNGQNGVGKSSLFMDAIADCLFEKSRDEEIGGWLRQGEKSGSVLFEFDMGELQYRVVRTRTKSGKGTLSFTFCDTGFDWTDCGDTTVKLTQAKIEQTLGMDAQTFCSIALIRQDAYGLFLETDSDRRMEVLSALLNLGVYVRLEELARGEASEQRKRIASLKDRMGVLSEQIDAKEATTEELERVQQNERETAGMIQTIEEQLAAAQREEALHQQVKSQADEKDKEADALTIQASDKNTELSKITAERDEAQSLANMLDASEKAAVLVAAHRSELDLITPHEAGLKSLTDRRGVILASSGNIENGLKAIEAARAGHQSTLARREEIETAVKAVDTIREERIAVNSRYEQYNKLTRQHTEAKAQRQTFLAESKQRIGELDSRLAEATKKSALLDDSECPIVETATCAFLKDAQAAKSAIAELETNLAQVKEADKTEYERLSGIVLSAQAMCETLGDPAADLEALGKREREASAIAALAPKLEAAAATIAELDKQETEYRATLKQNADELESIAEKMTPLQVYEKRIAVLRDEIRTNEPTANLLPKCTAAAATVETLGQRIRAMEKDIQTLRHNAEECRITARNIRATIDTTRPYDIAHLTQDKRERESYKTTLSQRVGGLNAKLESIASAEAQWKEYRDETTIVARTLNDYQTLAQAFGIDGIQYMIIRGIVPEIMHRANDILAAMTGGRMAVDFRTEREQKSNQKIVNSLDVWITSMAGGSRPYNSHSGGEKVKIALAVTLALADIKARRAGAQLGMLFIDEPPFLDADGTEAYADALSNIATRNPSMRILAISHDPAMKARFPQNITVTSGDNGSEVSVD